MSLAGDVLESAKASNTRLAFAESLTGGALSSAVVEVAGASQVLLGSIVAYDHSAKHGVLGVTRSLLANQGAVDPEVAVQMAQAVAAKFTAALAQPDASVLGVATTGVAGPDPQDGKPVGLVYIALSLGQRVEVHECMFEGDRASIRESSVNAALQLILDFLRTQQVHSQL